MLRNCTPTGFRATRAPRAGITLIEIVVVIAILVILLALLLPGVQQARASSRKLQCKNNLRNVALALIARTESQQSFPASGYFGVNGGDYHSWVLTILPWLDESAISDRWDFDKPFNSPGNLKLANTFIPVLTCPDDTTVVGQGDLSFVINGGFGWTGPPCGVITPSNYSPIDLNGSGPCTNKNIPEGSPSDRDLMFQTGLTFCENWPRAHPNHRRHNLGTLTDGVSHTLMLAESIHAGYDPTGHNGCWGNPNSWRTCFFMSGHVCQGFVCTAQSVNYEKANDHSAAPYSFEALNAPFQAEGAAPWPGSFHAGGLNFAFCDGSVRFLSENIDGSAYARLVTPQGSSITGPLAQTPDTDDF